MTDMRNAKDFATISREPELRLVEIGASSNSLRNSAAHMLRAPTSFNGCISEISSSAIAERTRDYAAAMRNYGLVYEEYQSYLMPAGQTLAHDYDMVAQAVSDSTHLGCLNADFLDCTVSTDEVSDDDIETCGYMAWVHH